MEVLKIALGLASIIGNGILVFYAIESFFFLRNAKRDIKDLKKAVAHTALMVRGQHVRNCFDDVNRMKQEQKKLVESEQFEQAKFMQDVIEKAERLASLSLVQFKEAFGKDADIIVINENGTDEHE